MARIIEKTSSVRHTQTSTNPLGRRGESSSAALLCRDSRRPWCGLHPQGLPVASQACREASSLYDPQEYDVVVSAGEQITSGLLAITLQAMGVPARSWLGWQLPIHTDTAFAKARIGEIDTTALDESLASGVVAVIPGFQGVAEGNRVTTLGRGGSDTSAVAIARAPTPPAIMAMRLCLGFMDLGHSRGPGGSVCRHGAARATPARQRSDRR